MGEYIWKINGYLPFSVGEIMIAAGAFLTAIALLLAMAFVAVFLFKKICFYAPLDKKGRERKRIGKKIRQEIL